MTNGVYRHEFKAGTKTTTRVVGRKKYLWGLVEVPVTQSKTTSLVNCVYCGKMKKNHRLSLTKGQLSKEKEVNE